VKRLGKDAGAAPAVVRRQIAATDAQIDRLVYELHGLTEEEIKIVDDAAFDLPCNRQESKQL